MLFLGKNENAAMKKSELEAILDGRIATILIDDKIEGAAYLPWHSLTPYQGNLKELSRENEKKMLLSLLDKGFFDIKKVWRKEQTFFIVDGHQTIATLSSLRAEIESGLIRLLRKSDNQPTDLIPCVLINADNEKDLSEKLLLINSEYGEITESGLKEFQAKYGIADVFMINVASFKKWQATPTTWEKPVNTEWTPPPSISIPPTTADLVNTADTDEPPKNLDKKELPSGDYVEYPMIFKKEDYDFFVSLVKRVKSEQFFEKNSEAIIHIARQYDTYVGSL